jgi:hypothetical protein
MEVTLNASPLEDFVRDYVDVTGGVWEAIEPQVYDVLLPIAGSAEPPGVDRELLRIAFDPDAIPEHPGAQLVSYGTPLIDRLLADAIERGRCVTLYLIGLNLTPHDLAGRVRRLLTLPAGASLHVQRVRQLHFTQAMFWFQATFVSDQKEHEIVPAAVDLHYGRQVRHHEALLDHARLAESPSQFLPEARRLSLAAAYPLARERAVRSIAPLANSRSRQESEFLERQIARMSRYYADLRNELQEQVRRAADRSDDVSKYAGRREALEREEKIRIAELRQKSSLRVHVRLLNLLVIQQPKLLIQAEVSLADHAPNAIELVWDPLMETLEAVPCPQCQRPTFALEENRQGRLVCPDCVTAVATAGKPGGKR